MEIGGLYSHLNGLEWLQVHEKAIWGEIKRVIAQIDASKHKSKESKEKGQIGRLLYSPKAMNVTFAKKLNKTGWKASRTGYWVTDDHELIRKTMQLPAAEQKKQIIEAGKRPIFSYNQTDFVKRRVAIEIQFGKYSFIAYDLFVKHLAFYVGNAIDVGIEILPMKAMQEEMSSGPGYYEGALYDVLRQGRGVPAVPLVVVGVQP